MYLNSLKIHKEIEAIIKTSQQKEKEDGFSAEFYQTIKEKNYTNIPQNIPQN